MVLLNSAELFSIFSFSLILSWLLVPILRKIAFKLSIVDVPNQEHKTHQVIMPYLGGFSIILPIVILASLIPIYFKEDIGYYNRALSILAPALFLAIIGLVDDIRTLSAKSRFLIQSLVSVLITYYLVGIGFGVQITGISIIDFLISIVWLVGITNAFNFFDNLDGGAAGVSAISSLTVFCLAFLGEQYLIAALSLVLAGSSLGFLYWNKHPARIYMGDSGSLFLGFLLAVALLQFGTNLESRFVSALLPIFILALPIMDTTVVVFSRLSRGVSVFQGGQDHISHRLMYRGLTRSKTAFVLWALGLFFGSTCILLTLAPVWSQKWISAGILFFMAISIFKFSKQAFPDVKLKQ